MFFFSSFQFRYVFKESSPLPMKFRIYGIFSSIFRSCSLRSAVESAVGDNGGVLYTSELGGLFFYQHIERLSSVGRYYARIGGVQINQLCCCVLLSLRVALVCSF